ncbi:MAG TPA: hypothetical protein VFL12_05475, partial [Thermoanaerobaculia bacterium]|nr:hypothetical protein [Thermoanaerobaculia bacterium]
METTAGPEVGSRPAGFPAVVARALGILPPRLRRRWWALLPLLFLQAVVDWGAAAAIYVFLAGSRPTISRAWVPAGVSPVVVLAILLLVKNALVVAAIRLETGLVADSTRTTFRRLLSGYLAAPLSGRDAAHSAELAHTATDALDDAFRRVLTAAASLASEAAVVAALVAAVLVRAPAAGLVAVAALAAALVTALRTTERAVAGSSRHRDELQAALRRDLGDVL